MPPSRETSRIDMRDPADRVTTLLRKITRPELLFLLAGLALALILRISLLDFKSLDYFASLRPWFNTIKDEGFQAFATAFSTYNPPYLYLLYLIARFLPDTPILVAVKLPSLVADFLCAGLVGFIVLSQSPRHRSLPYLAALAVLFAPSVVLNSAFWGQADSIFTAGVLACILCLVHERPAAAMIAFGIALAFKLQAIFLLPMLLAMSMRGRIPWRTLLIVPGALLVAVLPAWIAGRPLGELLQIYSHQASQFEFITMNAPNVYALVPETKRVFNQLYTPAVILGAAVAFLWFILLLRSRRPISGRLIVLVALVSMLVVPLFLPKMHDRYFYPADLIAIALGFIEPPLFFVPVLLVSVSSFAYQPFLFDRNYVPLPILALILIGVTAKLSYLALGGLFQTPVQQSESNLDTIPAVKAGPPAADQPQ